VIEIEEPPDIRACTTTMDALLWVWVARDEKWSAVSLVAGEPDLWRVHRCARHCGREPPYRQLTFNEEPDPVLVDRAHAGAERVRQELASKESAS
jgi:hypothetical protein